MEMNFFKNINLKVSVSLMALLLIFTACEDESKAPIVTFDSAGHGAYTKLLSSDGALLVNLLSETEFNSSNYNYTVEFIDDNNSNGISEVYVTLTYDPVSGTNVGPFEISRVQASSLTTGESGFKQATFEVNATTLASALSLGFSDFAPGDNFNLETIIVMTDGREFGPDNSSATVQGAAFQGGAMGFTRPLACPSDLTGTYAYSTTNIWCNGGSTTGTVDIEALGGGRYQFSDWAFGSYVTCYGGGSAGGDLTFTDVCAVVSFTGFTDSFGDTWTYTSSIDGNEWTIGWDNTYGESAISVITFPDGVPFTLN